MSGFGVGDRVKLLIDDCSFRPGATGTVVQVGPVGVNVHKIVVVVEWDGPPNRFNYYGPSAPVYDAKRWVEKIEAADEWEGELELL